LCRSGYYFCMHFLSKRYLLIGAGLIASALLGIHIYQNQSQYRGVLFPGEEKPVSESPDSPQVTIQAEGQGRYTIEPVPIGPEGSEPASGIPSLDRPVIFPAGFPQEARGIMSDKIKANVALLKKEPRSFDGWMNLAVLRKMIDDYEGARQIWEFLTLASPQQPGPFANLASLYAFDLKDPVRAKENFTKAIQKNPKDVSVYRNAYDFYRYFLKDNNQAKLMLTEGIAQTKSPDLQYLLDHYDEL